MINDDKQNSPLNNKLYTQDQGGQLSVPGMEQTETQPENITDNDKGGLANACPPDNTVRVKDKPLDATKREEPTSATDATVEFDKKTDKSENNDSQPEVFQKDNPTTKNKQTDKAKRNKKSSLTVDQSEIFSSKAKDAGVMIDDKGMYIEKNGETVHVSNIASIEFLYTMIIDEDITNRIRVVKINDGIFELHPEHLTSLNKFKRLLISHDNITFNGKDSLYQSLVRCILMLDNGKTVKRLTGLGKVQTGIYHLGNEIIIDGKRKPYQEIIWSGKNGVRLEKCGKMRIDPESHQVAEIWDRVHKTYADYAYIMVGFATATLYFDEIIRKYGCFPILYITGKSGTGKSKMAEVISNMLACDSELFTVNCDSLSTPIGVDEKYQNLNNLPLIMNEIYHKWFPLLKSRYDGDGAVKASPSKVNKTSQRQVKGSTLVTSVFRPQDSQVVSRSVFMDTSSIERDIGKFSELYHNRRKLSGFIISVLLKVKCTDVIAEIDKYQESFHSESLEPRIITNYAIIAGALSAFVKRFDIKERNEDGLRKLFKKEMEEAEKGLNPVYHLACKVRSMIEEGTEQDFLSLEERYVHVHIEGLWQYLPQSFRDQYYRKLDAKDIKNMFANSIYIARYNDTFPGSNDSLRNSPVKSYSKKINGVTKKCVVLLRDTI